MDDITEKSGVFRKLRTFGIVPVVSVPSIDAGMRLSEILLRSNLPVMEITFRTACAAAAITKIQRTFPEMLLLAGTVLDAEQVDEAVDSGAAAIVSPGFTPRLAAYCNEREMPFIPGVSTPSEVQAAMESGLVHLKFFPAALAGGVAMLTLLQSLYKQASFMPTGGIKLDNLGTFLRCANVFCCGGSWLCPEELMTDNSWDQIEELVVTAVEFMANHAEEG